MSKKENGADVYEELEKEGLVEDLGGGWYKLDFAGLWDQGYIDRDLFSKATQQYKFQDEEDQLGSADS